MAYLEIVEALGKGLNVYWMNTGYKVTLGSLGLLHVTFIANEYMTALQESEYQDCFIGE